VDVPRTGPPSSTAPAPTVVTPIAGAPQNWAITGSVACIFARAVGRNPSTAHLHQQVLHHLEPGDGAPELLALLRVGQRQLVGRHLRPGRAPGGVTAGAAQDAAGVGERALAAGEAVGVGHPDAVEGDVGVLHDPQARLALDLGDGDAGGVAGDDEAADGSVRGGIRVARPDHDEVGDGGVADPALVAVEDPLVTLAAGRGLHPAGDVGAPVRLGQAERPDRLHPGHRGEPPLALLIGAARRDRAHRETGVHAEEAVDARVNARDLQVQEAHEHPASRFAVGRADAVGGTREVERGEAGHQPGRELPRLPGLLDDRRDLRGEVGPQPAEQVALGVGEQVGVRIVVRGAGRVRVELEHGLRQRVERRRLGSRPVALGVAGGHRRVRGRSSHGHHSGPPPERPRAGAAGGRHSFGTEDACTIQGTTRRDGCRRWASRRS